MCIFFKIMITVLRNLAPRRILSCFTSRILNPITSLAKLNIPIPFRLGFYRFLTTMKLESDEFKSIFTPELKTLSEIFEKYGYEIRVAGGAVRDLLSGKIPNDIDFATTATPLQMKEMFEAENIRLINMNGERHGTITPRINDKENFEVTTLRIDVVTDGRHAEIKFTTDWKLDANRRDLTINSMFLGLDGTVYDYFNGIEDLKNKRVVFVGDAETRIQEDYLRILRYFRFYGRIATGPNNHEEEILKAIQNNLEGLNRISGERIWSELRKILTGNYAGEILETMLNLGIAPHIGLPKEPNKTEMMELWKRSKNYRLQAMTLMSSLFMDDQELLQFNTRVKLSAYDRDLGLFLIAYRYMKEQSNPLRQYQKMLINSKSKQNHTRDWIKEVIKYKGDMTLMKEFDKWKVPKFPVSGVMLMKRGVPGGKKMNPVMMKLRDIWAESDFQQTSEELLEKLPDVLIELEINLKEVSAKQ